jgi:hypothetical protein
VGQGYAHFLHGRFADARESLDRAATALRELPGVGFWYIRSAEFGAIWAVAWMGDLANLAERVERGLRAAELRGDLYARTTLCTGLPNLAILRSGDAHEARTIALDATRRWTQRGYHNQHYWSLLALTNVDLYEGDGRAAYARVYREWGRLSRALVLHVQVIAIEAIDLRARAALAAALDERGSIRARLLREATRCARRLERLDAPLAQPFAQKVHGGVAAIRGDRDAAMLHLDGCVAGFDAAGMALHANAARLPLAALRGGDEGRRLALEAEGWMRAQGLKDPASMAATIAPGFRE